MPLFEAIEADVAAFCVSQGAALDALIRGLLARVAGAEARVDALRGDVDAGLQSLHELLAAQAALAAQAPAPVVQPPVVQAPVVQPPPPVAPPPPAPTVQCPHGEAVEALDARVLVLSRQLNTALELVFRAPAAEDGGLAAVRRRQSQLEGVGAVLDANEDVFLQIGTARGADSAEDEGRDAANQEEASTDAAAHAGPTEDAPELTPIREEPSRDGDAVASPVTAPRAVAGRRSTTPALLAVRSPERKTQRQASGRVVASETDTMDQPLQQQQFTLNPSRSRKKSVYQAYQDLHLEEEARLCELQLRDDELLRRMQQMLQDAQAAWAGQIAGSRPDKHLRQLKHLADDNERLQAQCDELERRLLQQTAAFERRLQEHSEQQQRRLQEQTERVERWLREQGEREATMAAAQGQAEQMRRLEDQLLDQLKQREQDGERLEQQLQDAMAQLVAMHEAHAQSVAALLARLAEQFEGSFVAKSELDALAESWQQTATSNCVFGATPAALASLQRDLAEFQTNESAPARDEALESAVERLRVAVELALEVASDGSAASLQTPAGFQAMKALRFELGNLGDLVAGDPDEAAAQFAATALHRMELGTASLLDSADVQLTQFQEALTRLELQAVAHQEEQQELRARLELQAAAHEQHELALKAQLSLCPSQEDTSRLLQTLKDQMEVDAAGRLATIFDELQAKMSALPRHELLDLLATELQTKADRADMDLLLRLLQSQSQPQGGGSPTPSACLTKSPLRCLSCDQHLPGIRPINSSPTHACVRERPESAMPWGAKTLHATQSSPEFFEMKARQRGMIHVESSPAMSMVASVLEDPADELADELFAVAAAARRRRQRQQQLEAQSRSPGPHRAVTAGSRRSFVNLDDGRNRIPLRRSVLADHIIYGPSIAPHALRKKLPLSLAADGSHESTRNVRVRAGGEVITRSATSTARVRPFAELEREQDEDRRR